jgi:large subunit ribosomal protein L21e
MVTRIGGFRRKTRYKLQKKKTEKGKLSITRYLQSFKDGDTVSLKAEPSIHNGMYYPKFHGKTGVVVGKSGGCYEVLIKDGSVKKKLVVHPVHLKKLSQVK